jgi:hypothetical protein
MAVEFKNGKGFGRIAKENGLKLGPLSKKAKHTKERIKTLMKGAGKDGENFPLKKGVV